MRMILCAIAIGGCLALSAAGANEPPPAETPAATSDREYKPPPEFRTRKRGDKVVYCQKTSIEGSRLKAEKCYDEIRLRELLMQRELERRELEQRRRICPSPAACGV